MCGIQGFSFPDVNRIRAMMDVSRHRGPDAQGHFVDEAVTLGHNLLAIMEQPANSTQPWVMNEGRHVLCFNGEIYNWPQLRAELEVEGERFRTNGDTEVLAVGLRRHGTPFVHRLDGMFAFAWYDQADGTLLLARDEAGQKPFYYHHDGRRLIFASDIRALLAHDLPRRVDSFALSLYLDLGYVPGPRTLFEGIQKLVPGQIRLYDLRSQSFVAEDTCLARVPEPDLGFTPEGFRAQVHASVKQCLMGLRPVGLYLSGGMDSSMILHEASQLSHQVRTFTTRFELPRLPNGLVADVDYNDDADQAWRLSKHYGTDHTELLITEDAFIDAIHATAVALEEPRYNRSSPAYYLLAQEVARQGVVVTLAGEGGDELMAGYPGKYERSRRLSGLYARYPEPMVSAYQRLRNWRSGELSRWPLLHDLKDPINRWHLLTKLIPHTKRGQFNTDYDLAAVSRYMHGWVPVREFSSDGENNQMFLELMCWMAEDCLIRDDKLAMSFGMEGRFPLLSKGLRDYCFRLPSREKFEGKRLKILTRAAYEGVLPDYIVNKKKTGWASPALEWYAHSKLGGFVKEHLRPGYHAPTAELFDFDGLLQAGSMKPIFNVLSFQIWAKEFAVSL